MSELPGTQRYLVSMQMRIPIKTRSSADMCSPRNHTGLSLFRRLSLQNALASLLSVSASQVLLPLSESALRGVKESYAHARQSCTPASALPPPLTTADWTTSICWWKAVGSMNAVHIPPWDSDSGSYEEYPTIASLKPSKADKGAAKGDKAQRREQQQLQAMMNGMVRLSQSPAARMKGAYI